MPATFDAISVYGETSGAIPLSGDFDLIWVGSLLTHLGPNECAAFLELFRAKLRRNGLLVFTLHGGAVVDHLRSGASSYGLDSTRITHVLEQYAREGFGYASYPVVTPAAGENYGISLASPCWIYAQMDKMPEMQLVNYTEKGVG